MQPKLTTQLIRDRSFSVIASDIPPEMTAAQYRRRRGRQANSPGLLLRIGALGRSR